MTNVIYAVAVLGILGAVFGMALAFASKVFAVETDPRQEEILSVLPGANCGGCGYAGCSAYASAVASGGAAVNLCAAGGDATAAEIAGIMGVDASPTERSVALVKCSGFTGRTTTKFEYIGIGDCVAAMRLGGGQGPNSCQHGCIGMGTCVNACPFGAISIEGGIAQVDHEKCHGCMSCASACPKKLIVKVPYEADVTVACNSPQKGASLRKVCDIGCLGCKICEKTCEYGAISVVDSLAKIDYTKCVSCGKCAPKCPRKLIRDARLNTENEDAS